MFSLPDLSKAMKTSLILSFGLLISCYAHCQTDTLFIKGEKRSLELTDSAKVRIKTAELVFKGQLHIINDSTISVNSDTIPLKQIVCITTRRKFNRKVAGTVLTSIGVAGDIGTGIGAIAISRKSYGGFLGGLDAWTDKILLTIIGSGSVIVTTVGTILLCRNKNYHSGEYTYIIH